LFVLWLTPSFKPYQRTLDAVSEALSQRGWGDVPLIGSSVAVCLFDGMPHEDGAVLICLASRSIQAKVAVGENAKEDPCDAARAVLEKLDVRGKHDINPSGSSFLMTYLPGYDDDGDPASYKAVEIVEELRKRTFGQLCMFGGVSSAGLEHGVGSQFAGDRVYENSVAVALVNADIAYGIGINHGLVGTGSLLHVETVSQDGRTIQRFDEGTPENVMAAVDTPAVFGSGRRVIIPKLVDGNVNIQRNIPDNATLEIMRPDSNRMLRSVEELEDWVLQGFRVPGPRVRAVLCIGCVARYVHRTKIGFELRPALLSVQQRFPESEFVGCYMDGEVGGNWTGSVECSNWSLAEALFADATPARPELFAGFDALAKYTLPATIAPSLREAMERSLDCIERAGYRGAMISLVIDDGDEEWIVAQAARGDLWKNEVMPLTRREFHGKDILAIVAREGAPRFVADSQTDRLCDNIAAEKGKVTSFYAIPLLDENEDTIGVVQIDLGDMSDQTDIPAQQKVVLDAIVAMAAGAINRSIQTSELSLARRLDEILTECFACQTVEDAVRQFAGDASKAVDAWAHIRLFPEGNRETLRLVGGFGDYYDAARQARVDVQEGEVSSAFRVIKNGRRVVVNNAQVDPDTQDLRKKSPKLLGTALAKLGSYADFPIASPGEEPLGTLSFSSEEPWFFSPSRLRTLEDAAQRLSLLIAHVTQRELATSAQLALDSIAHNLRDNFHKMANWVQEISANLNMVLRRDPTAEQRELIEDAQSVVRRLMQLFGRVREGGHRLATSKRGWYQLDRLLSEAISRHTEDIEKARVRIHRAIDPVEAYVDGAQIMESFDNLIDNAIRAMSDGGDLWLSLKHDGQTGLWEALFRDGGPGIDEADIERLRRGELPEGRKPRSGMGLLLTRLYCQSHNGSLRIESVPGSGTTISMRIPATEPGSDQTRLLASRARLDS